MELNFGAFFGPFRVPNCPVLFGFCVPRELFLDCTFLFILGTCVTASRAVFEWPVFMTIPSRRMDSPR